MPRSVYTCFEAKTFLSGGSSLQLLQELLEQKISLYHVSNLHAKMLVVDDKLVHLGSQNFTKKGRCNKEAGCEVSGGCSLEWNRISAFLGMPRTVEYEDIFRIKLWLDANQEFKIDFDKICNDFNPLPNIQKEIPKNIPVNKREQPDYPKRASETEDDDVEFSGENEDQRVDDTIEESLPHQLPYTPSIYYERPLMMVLKNHDGCTRKEALHELLKMVRLVDGDFEKYSNGRLKWEFLASRARINLINLGYMENYSDNCWELTSYGWKMAKLIDDCGYPCFLPGRHPTESGNFLRERDVKGPLLIALAKLGGTAPRQKVLEYLELVFSDKFHSEDFTILENKPRWEVITSTAMSRLKNNKRFITVPDKGIWKLTQSGWEWVKKNAPNLDL